MLIPRPIHILGLYSRHSRAAAEHSFVRLLQLAHSVSVDAVSREVQGRFIRSVLCEGQTTNWRRPADTGEDVSTGARVTSRPLCRRSTAPLALALNSHPGPSPEDTGAPAPLALRRTGASTPTRPKTPRNLKNTRHLGGFRAIIARDSIPFCCSVRSPPLSLRFG
jgi:hypothetical protein